MGIAYWNILYAERQTILFSATQTRNVEDLARLSLRKHPLEVHIDEHRPTATVEGLEQGYVVCPSDMRFMLLFTFLKRNQKKKIMVFFSSCNSVKYHAELLNYVDVPVLDLHVRISHNVEVLFIIHKPRYFRASKSRRSEQRLSSTSAMHNLVSFFAQMLPLEV